MSYNFNKYSLSYLIRISDKYKKWRADIVEERGDLCESCGVPFNLHVHHSPIPFGKLYKEFLIENRDLDRDLDKEELLELAMDYTPFWDTENGEILCKSCHSLCHPNRMF